MKPIGLRFKNDGELMIVHECLFCKKISNNRIAGDDLPDAIILLVLDAPNMKNLLTKNDINKINEGLFGKK